MRLEELFTHGEGKYFIAYKEHLWLFDNADFESESDEKTQSHMVTALNNYDINVEDDETWYDLDMRLRDEDLDSNVLIGHVRNNAIILAAEANFRHSTASKTLLKVMDDLGVQRVNVYSTVFDTDGEEHEVEYEHSRDEFVEPLGNKYFYHGTSLKYLSSILKKGIMPNPEKTNYDDILHSDKIFVTLNPERAQFHAVTAAQKSDSFPVILKVKVPDSSKLVLDYDVAIQLYGTDHHQTTVLGYDDVYNHATKGLPIVSHKPLTSYVPKDELSQVRDKSSLNTKLGIFGYIGRVPPTMIAEVWVDEENIKQSILYDYGLGDIAPQIEDFNKFTPKEFVEFYKDMEAEMHSELADEEDEDE